MKFIAFALFAFSIQSFAITNSLAAVDEMYVGIPQLSFPSVIGGDEVMGACNGTLITKKLVATAGHCVYLAQGLESKSTVNFGRYKFVKKPDGSMARVGYVDLVKAKVKKFHMSSHLQQLGQQGMHGTSAPPIAIEEDMALVELENEVDFPIMPVATVAEYQALNNFSIFRSVSTNWFARATFNDIKTYADFGSIQIDGFSRIISSDSVHMVEEGDSGGPLLANIGGQWKLVGVVKGMTTGFSNSSAFAVIVGKLKF